MIGFSRVAEPIFCRTPPSGCLCALLERKRMKEMKVCLYCTQSDILLCGIARFSRRNKNKLRTFQPQKWKKIKNSQPQTKFTGSYKKECIYFNTQESYSPQVHVTFLTFLAVLHRSFRSHSEEILELAYVNFQFYLVTFYVRTSIQEGSSQNLSIWNCWLKPLFL